MVYDEELINVDTWSRIDKLDYQEVFRFRSLKG